MPHHASAFEPQDHPDVAMGFLVGFAAEKRLVNRSWTYGALLRLSFCSRSAPRLPLQVR
jgi:hypothetical protein